MAWQNRNVILLKESNSGLYLKIIKLLLGPVPYQY